MDDFGGWLPDWPKFLSWRGRIGRRAFLGGYILLAAVAAALGSIIMGALMTQPQTGFDLIQPAMIAVTLILLVPLSALIAQRSHDIGMSAFVPLILLLVFSAPMMLVFLAGHPDALISLPPGIGVSDLFPFAMIGNGLWMLFALVLFIKPGQKRANRFGDVRGS